ncbi:hypothetical protein [Rhodoferax sp.]|uniref:hypothetical protein n=1 Tax=Rhodoferax sp. TaxID=50421 RepID=UPI0025DB1DF5|nr:hypothetical protein [Rhodoferax sp.]
MSLQMQGPKGFKMFKLIKTTFVCSAMALLAGCGGGGDALPPAVTSFPVQDALIYAYTNGLQSTLNVTGSAIDGVNTYPVTGSLTITLGAGTSTTFNGTVAVQTTETVNGTLTIAGQSAPLNSFSTSYLNFSYEPLAYSTTGSYCEAASPVVYPDTASVGQSGNLGVFTCYTDSTKAILTGRETGTYLATAGSSYNTLDMTITTNIYDALGALAGTGSMTYTITGGGIPSLTQFNMSTTDSGITINITAKAI